MFESRQKRRKTDHVLMAKKQDREARIAELKRKNEMRLEKEKKVYEKSERELEEKGDERTKRQLRLYNKVFKPDEPKEEGAPPEEPKPQPRESRGPGEQPERLSKEEFLRQKKERQKKFDQKMKYKSLYGRKTHKGQPIMKYRINHLLSKIKENVKSGH